MNYVLAQLITFREQLLDATTFNCDMQISWKCTSCFGTREQRTGSVLEHGRRKGITNGKSRVKRRLACKSRILHAYSVNYQPFSDIHMCTKQPPSFVA